MNWTPQNIFDIEGKHVKTLDGHILLVKLDMGTNRGLGWSFYGKERPESNPVGLDIWSACYFLNSNEAVKEQ